MISGTRYAVSGARKIVLALAVVFALPRTAHSAPLTQDTAQGRTVYQKWCAGCHGDQGAGDGEGARHMLPPPRDFTGAIYQIRSTASGNLPTDEDLLRAIDEGLPGTAMPGWRTRLSDRERRDVMAYIKTFSTFFADTTLRPQALEFGSAPRGGGATKRFAPDGCSTTRSAAASATAIRAAATGRRLPRSRTTRGTRPLPPTCTRTGGSTAAAGPKTSTAVSGRGSTARRCRRSATCWSRSF